MSNERISYTQRPDTAPGAELSVLANIYALALQKHRDRHEATHPGSPKTEPRSRRIPPVNIVAHEPNLLASVRQLYSCQPEAFFLEAWELQSLLYSLGFTDSLAPEADIAAAVEVARTDLHPDVGAA